MAAVIECFSVSCVGLTLSLFLCLFNHTRQSTPNNRVHVRRGLDRFCLGQYFMEYGLSESVTLIPDDVPDYASSEQLEAKGLMEKTSPFQVFLKAVASEIVKEKGVTKGKKKRIKDYVEILQAFASEWVEYCNGTGDTYWANLRRQHG